MVYTSTITTPANTAASSPLSTIIRVVKGLIYKMEVYFPPGSAGLLHCRIFEGTLQIYPASPGETFFGDGITISFEDLYEVEMDPRVLEIETYNLDDLYEHKLQVRVGLVSKEEYIARFLPTLATKEAYALIERMGEANKAERQEMIAALNTSIKRGR